MDQELRGRAQGALTEWEDRKEAARETAGDPQEFGFYVTVRDAGRTGFLVGPYDTHEEALERVDEAKRLACEANSRGVWYAYGTSKVTGPPFPRGLFNDRFGLPPRA
jgi:hypothetical protein